MSKHLFLLLSILLSYSCKLYASYDFEIDGVLYEIYYEDNTKVYVSGYHSNDQRRNLTIPSQVSRDEWGETKTYTVAGIYNYSFNDNWLETVILPETITYIGECAFSGCHNLCSVNIPSNLEILGRYAFANTKIESVIIPDKLKEVSPGAFYQCADLKTVELGKGVNSFVDAFSGCDNLIDITVDLANMNFSSYDGAVYTKRFDELVFCPMGKNSLIMTNLAEVIPEGLFRNHSKLKNVTLGESVKSIGDWAFSESGIVSITLPDAVESIGVSAFFECRNLASISIGSGLLTISGGYDVVHYLKMRYLLGVENLEEITVSPEHPLYASFDGCLYDKSYSTLYLCPKKKNNPEIHSSTTLIEEDAFRDCVGITDIKIPSSVMTINNRAFMGCANMETLEIEPNEELTIWKYAFDVTHLRSIFCNCQQPPRCSDSFEGETNQDECDFFDNAVLYVPRGTSDKYRQYYDWYRFKNMVEYDFAGIDDAAADNTGDFDVEGFYNAQGVKSDKPWHGVNIVRYTNGRTAKKCIFK